MPSDDFESFAAEMRSRLKKPAYSPRQIREVTGQSRWSVDRAITSGKLPAYRFGDSKVSVLKDDLIRYIWISRTRQPKAPSPPDPKVPLPRRGRPPEKTRSRAAQNPVRHRTAGAR
jgi:hypothetical protein